MKPSFEIKFDFKELEESVKKLDEVLLKRISEALQDTVETMMFGGPPTTIHPQPTFGKTPLQDLKDIMNRIPKPTAYYGRWEDDPVMKHLLDQLDIELAEPLVKDGQELSLRDTSPVTQAILQKLIESSEDGYIAIADQEIEQQQKKKIVVKRVSDPDGSGGYIITLE